MADDGKPHRSGSTQQSQPFSDWKHSSDKGDRKDDLGRLCVSRLAPLRCVFPEYCVPSTSDSHVIFSALPAVDTPASQAEAGG